MHILSSFNFTDLYILSLSLIFIIFLFFAGRSITGDKELQAIQIPVGMFLIYFFFITGSVLKINFSITNVIIFLFILSIIGFWRSKNTISKDIQLLILSFILILPLLTIGILSHNYLWDDYTNWLPPARYLYQYKHLPTLNEPLINGVNSSYPYLRALIHSLINLAFNEFIMNIQVVQNILFGSTLFLWSQPIANLINFEDKNRIKNQFILMSSFLCFLFIIWIITLDKLLFSSYSEAFYLIFIIHLYLYLILKINKCDDFKNGKFNITLSILLAGPIIIKDVGFYHSIIIFMSYIIVFEICLIGNKNKNTNNKKLKKLISKFLHLIPLFFTKIIWSYYVNNNQLSEPFESIITNVERLKLIPQMLSSVKSHFIENTSFILALIIILLLFLFSKKSKELKIIQNFSLFLFTLLSSLGIIALTLIAYILFFSDYELARAASFTRYINPVTFMLWGSILVTTLNISNMHNYKLINRYSFLIVIIYLLIIFFNYNKFNYNKDIDNKFIKISSDIINNYPKDMPIYIIDLQGNGIESVKIRFYVNEYMQVEYYSALNLKKELSEDNIKSWFKNYKNIHIHSASTEQLNMIRNFVNKHKN